MSSRRPSPTSATRRPEAASGGPRHRAGWRRASAALALAAAAALLSGAPPLAAASFEDRRASRVESLAPILDGNVQEAHLAALRAGFRKALVEALQELGLGGRFSYGSAAMEDPARYILGYRVEGQDRQDLFYRLRLSVWVDRQLLREEMLGRRGGG